MANGKGLAYAGLILGLIGAGLGGYVFFDNTIAPLFGLGEPPSEPPSEVSSEINSYYNESYDSFFVSTNVYVPITGMSVLFNTTANVTLHILYTGYVRIITAQGTNVEIIIRLNSTTLTNFWYFVEEFGAAAQERFAVNMQNYIPALLPGNYNVTVLAKVDHTSTIFYMNSLYVQTHT